MQTPGRLIEAIDLCAYTKTKLISITAEKGLQYWENVSDLAFLTYLYCLLEQQILLLEQRYFFKIFNISTIYEFQKTKVFPTLETPSNSFPTLETPSNPFPTLETPLNPFPTPETPSNPFPILETRN